MKQVAEIARLRVMFFTQPVFDERDYYKKSWITPGGINQLFL
jgi:hypothetical protein